MESDWRRPALHERILSFALAVTIALLCLFALLSIAPNVFSPPKPSSTPVTFELAPAPKAGAKQAARKTDTAARAKPDKPKPPVPVPVPVTPAFVELSAEDFAASDIGAMRAKGDGEGDSASATGPGEGPGGARLYRAEWYAEPPDSALAPYLPNGAPQGSWAMVACRTVEKYHVDNCVGMGESPPGSGLAKALRLAAWQFLVRPPRLNGKPLIGAWVRIRFDFTKGRPD